MSAEAISVSKVLAGSKWIGALLAKAKLRLDAGVPIETVARELYDGPGSTTLTKCREFVERLRSESLVEILPPRERTGSAENPITKLFPAALTEARFAEELDALIAATNGVRYEDERHSGHTLVDFRVLGAQGADLPINVKNAGTRFENALSLVGLEPNDCIPIPAYKAHDAVEKEPNLLYAVAVDYELAKHVGAVLVPRFDADEMVVWNLLKGCAGSHVKDAEDLFVYGSVKKHLSAVKAGMALPPFRLISARRAIRILQTVPKRTPGIGLRAWGTGASAEVNVHVSIKAETTPWEDVVERIRSKGVGDVVAAVNRKRQETVFDPLI